MAGRAVYRFTADLRLEDHAGLAAAAAHGGVVPVLVIDRELHARLAASPRRAAFYCGAVAALDAALHERGSALIVRRGPAGSALKNIARAAGAETVAWSARYDPGGARADRLLQSQLEERGHRALVIHDAPAIAPEETTAARPSSGDGYRAFVPYHELWRTLEPASYELPLLLAFASIDLHSEPLPEPSEFGSGLAPMEAGGTHARRRLDRFLAVAGGQYALGINAPAQDGTSHLSAELSFGTIAARTIVRETRARLDDPFALAEERVSLRLFLRSLAMRDFFLQLAWYHPRTEREALQEKMRDFPFLHAHPALDAWRAGRTGYPLVDAGIRQLRQTGWMHPRVRAIVASFLCFDLGVHWEIGLSEWRKHLIEDDEALAIGNWQWIAGVGADLAAFPRIYNPLKQARRYDPGEEYVRRWIPDLVHMGPLFGEPSYPAPVVDHDAAARAFLKKYQEFTGGMRSSSQSVTMGTRTSSPCHALMP